jgi:hypothetical protein
MAGSYFVDRVTIGYRFVVDQDSRLRTGWRPTAAWAARAARRRLRPGAPPVA